MSTPVIKVAKSGFDIRTADPRDLAIDSTKNQFKVEIEETGTVTFAAKSAGNSYQRLEVDIQHNLGYQPTYLFYAQTPDGRVRPSPYIGTGSTGPTNVSTGIARVTDNILRLYFYVWDPFLDAYSSFNVYYKCLIYSDPNKNVWT